GSTPSSSALACALDYHFLVSGLFPLFCFTYSTGSLSSVSSVGSARRHQFLISWLYEFECIYLWASLPGRLCRLSLSTVNQQSSYCAFARLSSKRVHRSSAGRYCSLPCSTRVSL